MEFHIKSSDISALGNTDLRIWGRPPTSNAFFGINTSSVIGGGLGSGIFGMPMVMWRCGIGSSMVSGMREPKSYSREARASHATDFLFDNLSDLGAVMATNAPTQH